MPARYLPIALLLLAPALAVARPDVPAAPDGPYAALAIPSVYAEVAEGPSDGPRRFTLGPASPNPFRSTTRLTLTVETAQRLSAAVYDALGRRVATLHDGPISAGTYALTFDAVDLPAGLYVVRVTDGQGGTSTRSVALSR